jgi:hypothetical protein
MLNKYIWLKIVLNWDWDVCNRFWLGKISNAFCAYAFLIPLAGETPQQQRIADDPQESSDNTDAGDLERLDQLAINGGALGKTEYAVCLFRKGIIIGSVGATSLISVI